MTARRFTASACLLFGLFALGPAVISDDNPFGADIGDPQPKLTLKMYSLQELVDITEHFPFNPNLPSSTNSSFHGQLSGVTPYGGMSGGGGSFGGGSTTQGGGGFFSIPASPQFGPAVVAPPAMVSTEHFNDLIELLTSHIDYDSWEDNGGSATITALNNTLLVRQTLENHATLSAFLDDLTEKTVGGQPVQVELWWIPVDTDAKKQLAQLVDDDAGDTKIQELCNSSGGQHGTVRCRNRFTSNVCSGFRMPLITGKTPVVGTTVGYQSRVTHVNIGLFAEVTPRILDRDQTQIQIALRTAFTTMDNHVEASGESDVIDRFELGSQVLETNTVCQIGKLTIMGSLASLGTGSSGKEVVVVVRGIRP